MVFFGGKYEDVTFGSYVSAPSPSPSFPLFPDGKLINIPPGKRKRGGGEGNSCSHFVRSSLLLFPLLFPIHQVFLEHVLILCSKRKEKNFQRISFPRKISSTFRFPFNFWVFCLKNRIFIKISSPPHFFTPAGSSESSKRTIKLRQI